jgi:hypothetical protein
VAVQMQDAQAAGNGIVTTTRLTTVANPWWGVAAGVEVNVTWILLGRTLNWEAELPPDIRKQVVPSGHRATDPFNLPLVGPFRNFPNLDTGTQQVLSVPQANLLSSLGAWVLRRNHATLVAAIEAASAA